MTRTMFVLLLAACGSKRAAPVAPTPARPEPAKPEPAKPEPTPTTDEQPAKASPSQGDAQAAAAEYYRLVAASHAQIESCLPTKVTKTVEIAIVTKFDSGGGVMRVDVVPSQGQAFDDCIARLAQPWKLTARVGETISAPRSSACGLLRSSGWDASVDHARAALSGGMRAPIDAS